MLLYRVNKFCQYYELTIVVLVCGSVVEFASSSDMRNAIEKLDGSDLNGRVITVTEDRGRDSGSRRRRR